MSISYTKRGWTNNSPPAINAANLGAMDDALKLTADKVDTIAEGADVTATALASAIEGGTPTTTPDDTDKIPGVKSDHSRLYYTWANIKTALGSVFASLTHASRHRHGGADEIATATPAANAIPKADSSGKLDSWISDASASTKGKVQLAVASELVTGTDDTKAPTAKQLKDATALDGFWLTRRTKMPDGATAVYSQDAWATTDGWGIYTGLTMSKDATPGCLRGTVETVSANNHVIKQIGSSLYYKTAIVRYRASRTGIAMKVCAFSTPYYATFPSSTDWTTIAIVTGGPHPETNTNYFGFGFYTGQQIGDWFEIDWIWIGDYQYITGTLTEDGASLANYIAAVPIANHAFATGTITSNGTNVSPGDYVKIHVKTYTFVNTSPTNEGEVLIGATAQESLTNLALAINRTDSGTNDGVKYKIAAAHPLVSASATDLVLTVTALQTGELGNQITLAKSAATLTLSGSTLIGGYSATAKKLATLAAPIIAGNGTRPAAAKIELTDTTLIGYENIVDVAAGGTTTLPSGGTWVWMVFGYGATVSSAKKGTSAGGATLTIAGANATVWYRRYA